MSRLNTFQIPLFTREAKETVERYLLHFSRSVKKALRETREVANDNETQIDAMKMRRWFMSRY